MTRYLSGRMADFDPPPGLGRRPPRRQRWYPRLPRTPESSWAPGAKKYLPKGELMMNALLRSRAWKETWLPFLAEVQDRWGAGRLWSALELERVLLAAIETGHWNMRPYRAWLTGDEAVVVRQHLCLVGARMRPRRGIRNSLNVPSLATLSRYRTWVPWEDRATLARRVFELLRDEAFEHASFEEAVATLYIDSYDVFITGRPEAERHALHEQESPSARRYRIVKGAGRVGRRRDNKPGGPGFKVHDVVCSLGLPLVLETTAIQVHDQPAALERVLPELEVILGRLNRQVRVMVGDAAYRGAELLKKLLVLGFVPCIHPVSHNEEDDRTQQEVAKRRARWWNLESGSEPTKWWANGLYEFGCECGGGTTAIDISLGKRGQALARTDLECDQCGHLTVTAGKWRVHSNPSRYVKEWIDVPTVDQRPALGNPLTYDSPYARAYGKDRFGYNEGFHGQLERAYRLGGKRNRAPIESQAHLEYVLYTIAGFMWANAIEQIRKDAARTEAEAA